MADWLEDYWYAALGWVAEHPIALFALVFMAACVVYLALTKNPQQVESTRSSAKLAVEIILFLAIFGVALVGIGLVLIGGTYWLLEKLSTAAADIFLALGTYPVGIFSGYLAYKTADFITRIARGFMNAQKARAARLLRENEGRNPKSNGGTARDA